MAKSLCKYRRVEIADKFDFITQIVSVPNFICSSCARVASDKGYLCKPSALVSTRAAVPHEMPSKIAKSSADTARQDAQSLTFTTESVTKLTDKQSKKLAKLAKKKEKRLKQAEKAAKRYDKAIVKAQAK